MDNFMLLSIGSIIGNAIAAVLKPILIGVVEPILNVFMPLLGTLIQAICTAIIALIEESSFKTIMVDLGVALFEAIKVVIEGVLDLTVGKEKMVNVTLDFASKSFTQMTDNKLIKMLSYTPLTYFDQTNDMSKITISDVNPYFLSLKLMKEAILPTAMTIFALIAMIELFQITIRTEGMRNSGFESPFKFMLKVAVCKILIDNTQNVLEAIFNLGRDVFFSLYNIGKTIDLSKNADWEPLKKLLMKVDWFSLIVIWGQMSVQLVAVWIVMLIIPFIVFARVIEMYIMIVLAPIPFATFLSQEFSQVGKNFLKQFIGISLKTAVMYVIILVYCLLINIVTFDITNTEAVKSLISVIEGLIAYQQYWAAAGVFAATIGVKPILFAIMLLLSLLGADKYTRQITGAWY